MLPLSGNFNDVPQEVRNRIYAFLPFEDVADKKKSILTSIAIAQLPKEKPPTAKEYIAKLMDGKNTLLSHDIDYHHNKLREVDENLKKLTFVEANELLKKDGSVRARAKLWQQAFSVASPEQMDFLMNNGEVPLYYELLFPYAIEKGKAVVLNHPSKVAGLIRVIKKQPPGKRICIKITDVSLDVLQQLKKATDPEFVRFEFVKKSLTVGPQTRCERVLVNIFLVGVIAAEVFGLYTLSYCSLKSFTILMLSCAPTAALPLLAPLLISYGAIVGVLYINAKKRMEYEERFVKQHLAKFLMPLKS